MQWGVVVLSSLEVWMAIIKKKKRQKTASAGWKGKRILASCWWGCKLCVVITENNNRESSKIKTQTAIWARNPTPGNLSKGNKTSMLKRYLYFDVYYSTTHNSQELNTTKISLSWWVNKKSDVFICNGMLLGYKKKERFSFVTS